MSKIILPAIAMLSLSFSGMTQAAACKWGLPSNDMQISKLQYNGETYPYVTLSDGREYTLFKSWGEDYVYGRTMLAVALTAITIGATVDVCISGSDVSSITIKQ